ncbi:MAG TPA: CTP synthase [Bacteroidetes bacterium]|nr:CTP synthase [Bacteroidota bacterium]HRK04466.1 CTP synthase [Chlorobiota bacterium]
MPKSSKYIFITGGVLSSLGKGIASSSIGLLLKQRGYSVTVQKFDPYINVDPGTMNPYQHGEVYVTDDGAETDLDLGHYERYLDVSMTRANTATAGQVYYDVIMRERRGEYLGKTVQVIPHITDEIKRRMRAYDGVFDVIIIEIGGTVGDIEGLPFLEAARQHALEVGRQNALFVHLTFVPYIKSAGEVKTKPTQHSVKTLMEFGIMPDLLLCRSEVKLDRDIRAKIALFCNVEERSVVEALDAETIYEVPMMFAKRELDDIICEKLHLKRSNLDLDTWSRFVHRIKAPKHPVTIAIVGKYVKHQDSYKSISEAFIHAGAINNAKVNIRWIDSEHVDVSNVAEQLDGIDGLLVAPGFGSRGIEGKISAIRHVREHGIPFFGICLGMQCAVIEFGRNVCGLPEANSSEFKKNKFSVIDLLPEQRHVTDKGGTMRLGAYPCTLKKKSKAAAAYKTEHISERHRHRYEFNNEFRELYEGSGMVLSGTSPDEKLVEIIELPNHPWFVGVQFHPEYKSRAVTGHPLFVAFVKAALHHAQETVDA